MSLTTWILCSVAASLFKPVTSHMYVQQDANSHNLCESFKIIARSNIECTLKCKRKQKIALFTSASECFCTSPNGSCKGAKTNVYGKLIRIHEQPKCPKGFDGEKCDKYIGEGVSWSNPAVSCKYIREVHPTAPTGYYWVQFVRKSVHVYCDMVTEGGGWLLIGNITTTSEQDAPSRTYKKARSYDYDTLSQLHNGFAVLDGSMFGDLYKRMDVKQFRIFCTKQYHKRIFHVINKLSERGLLFRDYILGDEVTWLTEKQHCQEALLSLPDDDSYLSEACNAHSSYVMSQGMTGKDARLYDHVLFEHGNLHVQLFENNRLECDDFEPKKMFTGYNQVGQWLYYLR